jgi:hypothetical protein
MSAPGRQVRCQPKDKGGDNGAASSVCHAHNLTGAVARFTPEFGSINNLSAVAAATAENRTTVHQRLLQIDET